MIIEISQLARKELEDSVLYYELELYGLGLRFKDEVRKAIDGAAVKHDGFIFQRTLDKRRAG